MAVKHVESSYRQLLKDYTKMVETYKHLEEAYNAGELSEDRLAGFVPVVDNLKLNLDRVSYIMYLLKQPRFNWPWHKKDAHQEALTYFANVKADEKGVFEENNSILEDMDAYVKMVLEQEKK